MESGLIKKQFQNLLACLKLEREAEITFFREKFKNTTVDQRRKEGVTWYPVRLVDESVGLGERIVLLLERNEQDAGPHLFQGGSIAALFSYANPDAKEHPFITGVVISANLTQMKLSVHTDDLPDWVWDGKLGVDLYYDERTYREMERAVQYVMDAENNRLAELREILYGQKVARFKPEPKFLDLPGLNESQNEAVSLVERAKDIALVHGPPGTGKTTTLVRAVSHVLKSEKQVLVCAASNLAVDLLTERLGDQGIRVLRLGHPARITESVLQHSLDAQIQIHPSYKELRQLRKDADEIRRQAYKFKRSFGQAERQERKEMLAESKSVAKQAKLVEEYILDSLLDGAQVITCTLMGATAEQIRDRQFSSLFIDEAAQATEPACWIAISRADRVIFAGDHRQLPPTVKSEKAEKLGYGRTLFEKCMELPDVSVMLRTQYRMHADIMGFSNAQFYGGLLEAHESVAAARLFGKNHHPLEDSVIEFVDTAGAGYTEVRNPESQSTSNPSEAEALLNHLEKLLPTLRTTTLEGMEEPFSVAIISPYKDQVNFLNAELPNRKGLWKWNKSITVGTVDGFQGQEREIVYISLVRSNDDGEIGFLRDTRRMNVAMTRAKRKLVVFGDSATMGNHPFYRAFLDYIDQKNAYRSVWELMEW